MRKSLLILLALLPLFGFGQWLYPTGDPTAIVTQNNSYIYFNSLEKGDVLFLQASKILASNLTYNSSGLTVSYASSNRVKLTGNTNVRAGNSVRFGSPTTGTIYQIQSISTDTLTLDQTFTGSVSDEFYWGGVGTWLDESGAGNNATQSTASLQPKLLWAGTTSAEVYFDGVDDYMNLANNFSGNTISIYAQVTPYAFKTFMWIVGCNSSASANNGFMFYYSNSSTSYSMAINVYTNRAYITYSSLYEKINLIGTYDMSNMRIYKNATQGTNKAYSTAIDYTSQVPRIGYGGSTYTWSGSMSKIRVYNRLLTAYEIQLLSK